MDLLLLLRNARGYSFPMYSASHRWTGLFFTLIFAFVTSNSCAASDKAPEDAVTVVAQPVEVITRTFDPAHPPSEMPPLEPNEAAVTASQFECQASVAATISTPGEPDADSTITLNNAAVTISLKITIWLPTNVVEKIIDHENGHRKISEMFYANAEQTARRFASEVIGRTVHADRSKAGDISQKLINDAARAICANYLSAVQTPSQRVQELFDEITSHGRNNMSVDDAIKQALKRQRKQR